MLTKKFALIAAVIFLHSLAMAQPDANPGLATQPKEDPPFAEERRPITQHELIANLLNPDARLDRSTPEATLRSFMWSVFNIDFQKARECVRNALPYEKLRPLEKEMKDQMAKADVKGYQILLEDVQTYLAQDEATVTFSVLFLAEGFGGNRSVERFHLVRADGDNWLIQPEFRAPLFPISGSGRLSQDSLLDFLKSLVDPALMPEEMGQVICEKNLHLIYFAIMQHVMNGNDGKFTFTANDWKAQLLPYLKDANVLVCDRNADKAAGYSMNFHFGIGETFYADRDRRTILIYEGKDEKFVFCHKGKTNILFKDGHLKAYTAQQLEKALTQGEVKWK